MTGKDQLKELQSFSASLQTFLDGQPSGNDLNGCDEFLRSLHSLYATVCQKEGEAEIIFNRCLKHAVESEDEKIQSGIKLVKNSSTLLIAYVAGIYPKAYQVWQELKAFRKIFELTSDDYRTLISAFKRQFEVESSVVRQASNKTM